MYVFDLDGTLADASHRMHYITSKPKNWPAFFEACSDDRLIKPIASIASALLLCGKVAYLTGRPERYRHKTINWLDHRRLWYSNVNLLMRSDDDKRPDEVVKPELIKQLPYPVMAIFEDRTRVVQKWRELGYTCLQVCDGNY